jgi:pimeloyl-ACP methyl ester carboxylesterase
MYLRLPPGYQDAASVKGVVAYCTWTQDRNVLVQQLSYDINQPVERLGWPSVQLLRFATKHNLAVVTWSTPGRWQLTGNSDELERDTIRMDDRMFDTYAKAWARGIEFFCANYQLPNDNYLLYGMSRGAQWAHRLALRLPKYFLAVNPHVSGTYDLPTPEARHCLWLITGGEVDVGYENAIGFYKQCRAAGYPVIFKAGQDLGHETRSDIEALRDVFFEYALSIRDEFGQQKDETLFRKEAKFIGNYETQRVVAIGKIAEVPEECRVYLPTEELAEAWKLPPPEPEE